MRHLAIVTSLIIASACLLSPLQAEPKTKPELGSILDPNENPAIKKPVKNTTKDIFANIDQDLPSLPQSLRWELLLNQKTYGVTQNLRTASDLITSLTRAIESLCFSDLQRSLFYDPNNRSKECQLVEKYLLDLDAKNPLIPCLNFGIESPECREGYSSQITLDKLPREGLSQYMKDSGDKKSYSFQSDLDVTLDTEKSSGTLSEIELELSKLKQQTGGSPEAISSNAKKINELSNKSLAIACSKYRIVVFHEKLTIAERDLPRQIYTPHSKKDIRKGSLEDLLKQGPFSESAEVINSKNSRNHFRLVNQLCLSTLSSIEAINPNYPGIACYRDGFTAPSCLDARRVRGTNTRRPGNEGIERF